jgi:hypothetical protein
MARHDDLAHAEIAKAYDAYTSPNGASDADRIIIVLDLLIYRLAEGTGNGGKWSRVKKQGPTALGGLGLGAVVMRTLEALV